MYYLCPLSSLSCKLVVGSAGLRDICLLESQVSKIHCTLRLYLHRDRWGVHG